MRVIIQSLFILVCVAATISSGSDAAVAPSLTPPLVISVPSSPVPIQPLPQSDLVVSSYTSDPDVNRNFSESASSYGYDVETHHVVTQDGYILTLFRLPCARYSNNCARGNKPVVFLQHGLLDCGYTWILNGPNVALGYILADSGYDVWVGNSRGSVYSLGHTKYTTKDAAYWAFTFDQMNHYDVPANLDYILSHTNKKSITVIGHSQGGQQLTLFLNNHHEYAPKINMLVNLAPALHIKHQKSPLLTALSVLYIPDILDKFSHEIRVDGLNMYDFGSAKKNREAYGTDKPPAYNITSVPSSFPTVLFYGSNDWLANPTDMQGVIRDLKVSANLIYVKQVMSFEHMDFLWAVNAVDEVYDDIMDLLKKYNK